MSERNSSLQEESHRPLSTLSEASYALAAFERAQQGGVPGSAGELIPAEPSPSSNSSPRIRGFLRSSMSIKEPIGGRFGVFGTGRQNRALEGSETDSGTQQVRRGCLRGLF